MTHKVNALSRGAISSPRALQLGPETLDGLGESETRWEREFICHCTSHKSANTLQSGKQTRCAGAHASARLTFHSPGDVDREQWLSLTAKPLHKGEQKEGKLWFCFTEKDYDTAMKKKKSPSQSEIKNKVPNQQL